MNDIDPTELVSMLSCWSKEIALENMYDISVTELVFQELMLSLKVVAANWQQRPWPVHSLPSGY